MLCYTETMPYFSTSKGKKNLPSSLVNLCSSQLWSLLQINTQMTEDASDGVSARKEGFDVFLPRRYITDRQRRV